MPFNPKVDSTVTIVGRTYRYGRHPGATNVTLYCQGGRRGKVYRLVAERTGEEFAFKRFNPIFQTPDQETNAGQLLKFAHLDGLSVARRVVVSERTDPELFRGVKELRYAVLMPWIGGRETHTWADVLLDLKVGRKTLDPLKAQRLATRFLTVMAALESNDVAHTDIASGNVVFNLESHDVHLIDLEELYGPGLSEPKYKNVGTDGYTHRAVDPDNGVWSRVADRFAAAVLAAEILAATDAALVALLDEDHLFPPAELHAHESPRFLRLRALLRRRWPAFGAAFEHAWASASLDDCPPLRDLQAALHGDVTKAGPRPPEVPASVRGSVNQPRRLLRGVALVVTAALMITGARAAIGPHERLQLRKQPPVRVVNRECRELCPSAPHATGACRDGHCELRCDDGFVDRDQQPGCEVDTATDPRACGVTLLQCPSAPGATAVCDRGACALSCNAGHAACDGRCVDLERDPENCGRCDQRCRSREGDPSPCLRGNCATPAPCRPGYATCHHTARCAVNLKNDPNHCGACGCSCPSGRCDAGRCAPASQSYGERVSRIVAGQRGSIRSCYERELRNNPNLAGRLEMRVTIGPSGRVTSVSRSGLDVAPNVGGCVSLRVRALVFPPPERGDANFNFSWNFAPGG